MIPRKRHSADESRTTFDSILASFVTEIFHKCCPFGNTPLPLLSHLQRNIRPLFDCNWGGKFFFGNFIISLFFYFDTCKKYCLLLFRIKGYTRHFRFLLIKTHILAFGFVTERWIMSRVRQNGDHHDSWSRKVLIFYGKFYLCFTRLCLLFDWKTVSVTKNILLLTIWPLLVWSFW